MAKFIFICPHCNQSLAYSGEEENTIVSCPACNNEIVPIRNIIEESTSTKSLEERPGKISSSLNYKLVLSEKNYDLQTADDFTSAPQDKIARTKSISVSDEIQKFKTLFDSGVITEEEFKKLKENIMKHLDEPATKILVSYASSTNKKCPYCKKDVEKDATTCPYCRATFISTNPLKNIVLLVIIFLFLYYLISAFTSCEAERTMKDIHIRAEQEAKKLMQEAEKEYNKNKY